MLPLSALPNQYVKSSEWTEDYYKKCAISILMNHSNYWYSSYNQANRISEIEANIRLYFGEQTGDEWKSQRSALQSSTGEGGTTAVYTPGGESHTILYNHIGSIAKMVSNFDKVMSTKSLYANRNSTKAIMYDILTFRSQNKDLFRSMSEAGVKFKDIPEHINFQSKEEQRAFVEKNFKEQNEVLAYYLAKESLHRNRFRTEFKTQALWALVGGMVGMKIENVSSSVIPEWKTVASKNLIKDMRVDDNFGKYDEFVGEIDWLPIDMAIKRYDLNKEEAEELRAYPLNNIQIINAQYGFDMFTTRNNIGMVSVMNCYWRSYKDSKLKGTKNTDRYGNYHVKTVGDHRNTNNYLNTIRQATLIGCNIVKNYGERTNIPINSFGYRPPLPILTCTTGTGMIDGRNKSMAGKLQGLQRQFDQYSYKLQEAINSDYGKILFYDPSSMDATSNLQKMQIALRTTKTIEINRESGDGKNDLPVEMHDFSLSPTTSFYLTAMQDTYRRMQLITNTSDASLGMQTSTMGKGVMEQTIAQNSNGNYVWMSDLITHYQNITQYSADQARMNIAAETEDEIDIPLDYGDYGVIKATKEMAFENIGINISFDNIIDEQAKQNIIADFIPYIQLGVLPLWVMPKIRNAGSLTEIENIAAEAYKEMQEIKNRQQAAAFEEKAMLADQKSADSRYVADSQRAMTNDAAEAKLTETAVKLQHEQAMKEGEVQ